METPETCTGHENSFEHLSVDLGVSARDADLGYKYQEKESDVHGAEPLLVLYVSVRPPGFPQPLATLQYGLTRSKFRSGLTASREDQETLLEAALPHIREEAPAVLRGEQPRSTREVRML